MLFNSYEFICLFLPLVFLAYLVSGKLFGGRASIVTLSAASLFFYGWWNPIYLPLILFSILFNYTVGSFLCSGKSRLLLFFGVATNLALLGYFKYANFFVANYERLTGATISWTDVVLPIAISFFTFQQIAYLVDTSQGVTKERNFLNYFLFVTFFPQLIAGPIVHHSEMMPQFEAKKRFDFQKSDFAIGLTIFVIGLSKKVILADSLATFATPVFDAADSGKEVLFLEAWGAAFAYTFQLYFDFSGYSDMAIGIARLFGIKLPINFNSPYKATSIIEFWRMWHMTLSRFLRDYLYIPLGGNRRGSRSLNLMITMLLGGLWHGAGWNFLLWGGLHGVYLIINQWWRTLCTKCFGVPVNNRPYLALSVIFTFLVVVIAWVPFRATTFSGSKTMLGTMFSAQGLTQALNGAEKETLVDWTSFKKFSYDSTAKLYVDIFSFEHYHPGFTLLEFVNLEIGGAYMLLIALLIVWGLPNTQELLRRYEPGYFVYRPDLNPSLLPIRWRPSIPWAMASGIAVSMCILLMGEKLSEFLYFQF